MIKFEDLPAIANPDYFYLLTPCDGEHWGEGDLIHVATKETNDEVQTVCQFRRSLAVSKVLTMEVLNEANRTKWIAEPVFCPICNFKINDYDINGIPTSFQTDLLNRAYHYRHMLSGFRLNDPSYGQSKNSAGLFKNDIHRIEAMLDETEAVIRAYFWFVYIDQKGVLYEYYKENQGEMGRVLYHLVESKREPSK